MTYDIDCTHNPTASVSEASQSRQIALLLLPDVRSDGSLMKTLSNPQDLVEIQTRLQQVRADSSRQWGKMNAHQMLCHLCDAFRNVAGERPTNWRGNWFTKHVLKWLALQAPMKWPPGVKTSPEADQEIGGTKPVEFARDKADCEALMQRFVSSQSFVRHPMFGAMSYDEWMRWAYLHCDHHLRQFGV